MITTMMDPSEYPSVIQKANEKFLSGVTKSIEWRKKQLRFLAQFLEQNEELIFEALYKDLRRNKFEAYLAEVNAIRSEIVTALSKLDEWATPEKVKTDFMGKFSKIYDRKEPYGVCLILGAWNFPFLVTLSPLVSAIAAGNCAVIKPSELSFNSAMLLKNLIPQFLDKVQVDSYIRKDSCEKTYQTLFSLSKHCFPVIIAEKEDSARLVEDNRFDMICYTGGSHVAKIVMRAASQHLTPVLLELGGKNPCVVHRSCDLKIAARRICWAKFANIGQICLAPDYVLCDDAAYDELLRHMKNVIHEFFGDDPQKSDSLSRIIDERHFNRLSKLLSSGKIFSGGKTDKADKYIDPTILTGVSEDSPVMAEEIFGPILPVLKIKDENEAIASIKRREKPLALYIFSKDRQVISKILDNTDSGGVTVNDCMLHHNEYQPFGGVGYSGMGSYHGKYGFEAFSHRRSCFENGLPERLLEIRYAPYNEKNYARAKKFLRKKLPGKVGMMAYVLQILKLSLLGLLLAFLYQRYLA